MTLCDYAACTSRSRYSEQGWDFCLRHYRQHRADLHGEPWPDSVPSLTPVIDEILRWGCGTTARLRQARKAPAIEKAWAEGRLTLAELPTAGAA